MPSGDEVKLTIDLEDKTPLASQGGAGAPPPTGSGPRQWHERQVGPGAPVPTPPPPPPSAPPSPSPPDAGAPPPPPQSPVTAATSAASSAFQNMLEPLRVFRDLVVTANQGLELLQKAYHALERATLGLLREFEELGERVEAFAPKAVQAFAEREVVRIQHLQRIGRENNEMLARMINIQTEIQESMLDLKVAFLKTIVPVAPVLSGTLAAANNFMIVSMYVLRKIMDILSKYLPFLRFFDPSTGDTTEKEVERFFNNPRFAQPPGSDNP